MCVEPGAEYVSDKRVSYKVIQDPVTSLWRIKAYRINFYRGILGQQFTSEKAAKTALVNHLKATDKWGKAIYPGKDYTKRG